MIEKPKKERRFLKALGRVGEILIQEVLIKIGSNLIKKIGGKKTLPSILFLLASLSLFAQYPATGNKQRLGYQTTGDGLVFRGRASDTMTIKSSGLNNAYFILDTVNNVLFNYINTKGGWQFSNGDTIIINNNFTQPVDSLFFKTSVATNNVDTAKMRWDSDLGTVVLGMYDKVPNELGFKNFWLVKNQTGSTITKGSIVYANGTVGASGRITVAKFIANGSIDAKYLLGITAHDLTDGEDGYVISFGKIRQVNTDTFAAGSILYPSPTVAGVWTDVEPVAPNIDMPIGFCINSSSNNGTIAIRVASGYKLSELHDVAISSPVENSSLYYKGGLWRDTTAALLVSDTSSMLTPYLRKLDTISLSNRINLKLNISDTASMLTPYFRDADTTSLNLTSRFAAKLNISDTASMLTPYFRDADTTSLNLTSRFAAKLNISDTASMLTPYFRDADTTSLNLTSRFAAKENTIISGTTGQYFRGDKTFQTLDKTAVGLSNVDNTSDANKPVSTATQTALNLKLNISDTASMLTNYLRTGVAASTYQAKLNGTGFVKASGTTISYDNSTYLTTGTAASTYLPLTGGTLSNTQNNTLTINSVAANFNPNIALASSASSPGYHFSNTGIRGVGQTISTSGIGVQGEATHTDMNGFGSAFGVQGIVNGTGAGGNGSTYGGYFSNTVTVAGNNYGLYVTTASSGDYGIYQTGTGINYFGSNTSINGTLDVTGATTLSAPLTVNSSAVFNEGSTDSDFRVESDGNVNMVFVDASTDRVGIGTNAPTKTLDVNGEVRIATVTATPTRLLGKDGSNVVGEVTTLAQTGLMTRGETTETTGSPSAIFTVTHGLGSNPSAVIVTSAGIGGAEKIIYEVYAKNSTTFSVQAWNYDGTEASSKSVKIYWLAIK